MNSKQQKRTLYILIGLFLILTSSSFLFHDHEPAIEEPTTCHVAHFETVLATLIISLFLSVVFRPDQSDEYLVNHNASFLPQQINYHRFSNRAPPEHLH